MIGAIMAPARRSFPQARMRMGRIRLSELQYLIPISVDNFVDNFTISNIFEARA